MLPDEVVGHLVARVGIVAVAGRRRGCGRPDVDEDLGAQSTDLAGDLASLNAHTEAFGTLVENDVDDEVLFDIIFKLMELFE